MVKRIFVFVPVLLALLVLTSANLGAEPLSSDYAPDSGVLSMCPTCQQINRQYYHAQGAGMRWSESKVNSIQGWSNSHKLAIQLTDGPSGGMQTSTATGAWVSNLPNPTYQNSDDNSDGIREEAKIISQSPKSITHNGTYYARAEYRWARSFSYTNEMNIGAQKVINIGGTWYHIANRWISKVFYEGGPSCTNHLC